MIKIYTGCMFSGKTKSLIKELEHYKAMNYKVIAYKPARDNRYSVDCIKSHDGFEFKAISIEKINDEILEEIKQYDVIGLDEIHFVDLNDLTKILNVIIKENKIFVCAGLDLNYRGLPFDSTTYVLALADKVHKLTATCKFCGSSEGRVSHRISDEQELFVVGGDDKYIPLCFKCFTKEQVDYKLSKKRGD